MNELISVIIPVYNHANTLKKSIDSIFKQTYRSIEIIVVNDGSIDNYNEVKKEIEKEFSDKEIPLQFFDQENGGAPKARNKGFKYSKGVYVIFWDADIIGNSDMIERMHLALKQDKSASFAYSQFMFGFKKIKSQQYNEEDLKKNNYICTMSLIKRDDFPFFDESLKRFQDWDLWLTMMENKKHGIFIPKVLFKTIVGMRNGISSWIPSFVYKLPLKTKKVKKYEKAKQIVVDKHKLYINTELEKEIMEIIGKSYESTDLNHAIQTKKFLLELKPDADYALQISALSHDIERGTEILNKERRAELREKGYHYYKNEHAILSAKLMVEMLKKYKYDCKFVKKVEYLVLNHEIGGNSEVDILRDADSISFFEDNIEKYFKMHSPEQSVEKVDFMYNRVGKKAREIIKKMSFNDDEVNKVFKSVIEK